MLPAEPFVELLLHCAALSHLTQHIGVIWIVHLPAYPWNSADSLLFAVLISQCQWPSVTAGAVLNELDKAGDVFSKVAFCSWRLWSFTSSSAVVHRQPLPCPPGQKSKYSVFGVNHSRGIDFSLGIPEAKIPSHTERSLQIPSGMISAAPVQTASGSMLASPSSPLKIFQPSSGCSSTARPHTRNKAAKNQSCFPKISEE